MLFKNSAIKSMNPIQIKSLILVAAILATTALTGLYQIQPTYYQAKTRYIPSDRLLLDREGEILHEFRKDYQVRRLEWVSLDQVHTDFITTVLTAEDKRFFYHPGVDPLSLASSIVDFLSNKPYRRGASTVSMQTVHLLDDLYHRKKIRNRYLRKVRQIILALGLEMRWSKEEILTAYLNLASFRGELVGIAAGSYGLFAKSPRRLNFLESSVLSSLIRSPNAPIAAVKRRALRLCLRVTSKAKECDSIDPFIDQIDQTYQISRPTQLMPTLARKAFTQFPNSPSVRTTIDRSLQKVVQKALMAHVQRHEKQNMKDGAAIVLDNETGEVLAYVANTGKLSTGQFVDGAVALRQAGSVLKPMLYGEAFDRKILTAATLIDDNAFSVSVQTGVYSPKNYDEKYHGLVTVRKALSNSMNIPAVKTIGFIGGAPEFLKTLKRFGFTTALHDDFYGPSLALGAIEIRLIELANAYRTFINNGKYSPIHLFEQKEPRASSAEKLTVQVISPQAAFIISDILSDRLSRSESFGLENSLTTKFWTAAKTGTSKDMRDNWCVGYSSAYTVAVWAGNFSGAPMWNVSGVDGAAPVWKEIMGYLHKKRTSRPPSPPKLLTQKDIHFSHNGRRYKEWFLIGTDPPNGEVIPAQVNHHLILSPVNNERFALHPDIPEKFQRILFKFATKDKEIFVYLNEKKLGSTDKTLLWAPKPGKFQLTLKTESGKSIDSIQFTVR